MIFNSLCITSGFLRQAFNNWMDNAFDDLAEKPVCDNVSDVDGEISKHEEWKNGDLQEANASYDELNGLVTEMAELGSTENPYTTLTPEVSFSTVKFYLMSLFVPFTGRV